MQLSSCTSRFLYHGNCEIENFLLHHWVLESFVQQVVISALTKMTVRNRTFWGFMKMVSFKSRNSCSWLMNNCQALPESSCPQLLVSVFSLLCWDVQAKGKETKTRFTWLTVWTQLSYCAARSEVHHLWNGGGDVSFTVQRTVSITMVRPCKMPHRGSGTQKTHNKCWLLSFRATLLHFKTGIITSILFGIFCREMSPKVLS